MVSNFGYFSTHKHDRVSDSQNVAPSVRRQPQTKMCTASQPDLFFKFDRLNVNSSHVQGFRDDTKRQLVRAETIFDQYY